MRALIVGCGYVGFELGKQLVERGIEVFGLRRRAEGYESLIQAGIEPLAADITKPGTLARLPTDFDWVVNCASSSRGDEMDYRKVYLDGTRNLLDWLRGTPPKKYVYTSSTSVYAQDDGSVVDETSLTDGATPAAKILLQTESLLLDSARARQFPAVILRVAGIYGPDRGHWFKLFLRGGAAIEGDGGRALNMAHREDVAGAILAALEHGIAGEIYNVVDDEPASQYLFFQWLSRTLDRPMPPKGGNEPKKRKRGSSNKRVSNRKLKKELGYRFRFPTFREGYGAEIRRLQQSGALP
jgi:nucleoside-diphosphate-sugar epimerase